MAKRDTPNYARRLRLATELRRLRTAEAKLTGQQVRDRLGWRSSSKLSRIENGESGVKRHDLEQLLDLYDVAQDHRAELFALAEESQRSEVKLIAQTGEPDPQRRLLDAELDAESIKIWEPQVFPGLFQVPAYSRALLLAWADLFKLAHGGTDRRLEALRLRQAVLTRVPPPHVRAVIDESVLYRRFGQPVVMREQLAHVLTLCELPAVDVRVLRLSSEHVIGTGAFNYISFRPIHDVLLPDVVAIDQLTQTSYEDTEEVRHQYEVAFDSLCDQALDQDESRALIERAIAGWTG